jgi:glycosyltransferase involved in cell wall biosynthesis
MIVSFVCPSVSTPVGGVTALYEFANGLSLRGHEVHIAHGPPHAAVWGDGITSLEEISWFLFEPGVHHHVGPDAVASLPAADVFFGTASPRELGLPVLIVQGFEMFPKEMEREAFRTPCLKVCVAGWLIRAGASYGMAEDQFVHVPMGIDHRAFRVRAAIETRPLQVGMLFNPHPLKGWRVGLRALESVHSRLPEMRAIVFGNERPAKPLPEWISFVADPPIDVLVAEVYNRCSVFMQSSFKEGFGLTAIEAMACGCALVTTDNGGSDDYALPGRTALVAPPGDSEQLASHVETLLRDDALRIALARAGTEYVHRFQWDRAAELLEGYLERYIADPDRFLTPPIDEPTLGAAT